MMYNTPVVTDEITYPLSPLAYTRLPLRRDGGFFEDIMEKRDKEVKARWQRENPDKAKQYRDKWKKNNPKKWKAAKQKWRAKNVQKVKAHFIIAHAVECGFMESMPCHICDEPNTQAHHEDYSEPLIVLWLCTKHHAERHMELKKPTKGGE